MTQYPKDSRNLIKRGARKASYDRSVIHSILDASEICHVAFNQDGQAMVQPINFGRQGDLLFLHGSPKNRMTCAIIEAGSVCLSVMLLDGMKLTRSAFHHSVNFRSAVIFGTVRDLHSDEEKLSGLKCIINHFVPGRWDHCRHPDKHELKATRVIEIKIDTASAKIADTAPKDNKEDLDLDYWAGTIGVKTVLTYPEAHTNLKPGIKIPQHVLDLYMQRQA